MTEVSSVCTEEMCVLLECLGQVEALLYVVVVGSRSVDVSDAAVACFHFAVLLQGLSEGHTAGRETSLIKLFVYCTANLIKIS